MEDRLASVEINRSDNTELVFSKLGAILAKAVQDAERLDEIEVLVDIIGEYSTSVSYYGEATGSIDESMAVDLNEACLLKKTALETGRATEWRVYVRQFEQALESLGG